LKKFLSINLLKPNAYFMYRRLQHSEILCSAHNAFMFDVILTVHRH